MELKVLGSDSGSIQVSENVFEKEYNESLIHQLVTSYLSGARQGTRAQKTRSEVSGGGKKPWKQKGSGRARAGTIRSPIWRSGGVSFAAKPQDHSKKLNRKMYRAGMCSILSELNRSGRLVVVSSLTVDAPKTKSFIAKMKELDVAAGLFVTEDVDANLYLSARNIPGVDVRDVSGLDPVSLVSFDKVVITESALKKLEEVLI
jgi:large subunit ribosomal protein L4